MYDKAVKEMQKPTNSMLVIVLCMLGLDSVEPDRIASLKALQTNRYFNGLIGGIPQRAYYFVGRTDDNFIYLDPHVVNQGSNRQEIEINLKTFFCSYTLSLKSNKVHPSMGLCFYVHDRAELDDLCNGLHAIRQSGIELPFTFMKNDKTAYVPLGVPAIVRDITNHDYLSEDEEEPTYISEINRSCYGKSMVFEELAMVSPEKKIQPTEPRITMKRKESSFEGIYQEPTEEFGVVCLPTEEFGEMNSSIFEVVPMDHNWGAQ